MNEAETRAELIDPKLKENGWDGKANPEVKVHREYHITSISPSMIKKYLTGKSMVGFLKLKN